MLLGLPYESMGVVTMISCLIWISKSESETGIGQRKGRKSKEGLDCVDLTQVKHRVAYGLVLTNFELTVMSGVSIVTTVPFPSWKCLTDTVMAPPAFRGRLSSTAVFAKSRSLPLMVTDYPTRLYTSALAQKQAKVAAVFF